MPIPVGMVVPMLQLGSGSIPALGFGVGTAWYKCKEERRPAFIASVQAALDAGLVHLDEAEMYNNEETTGVALREWLARSAGVPMVPSSSKRPGVLAYQ